MPQAPEGRYLPTQVEPNSPVSPKLSASFVTAWYYVFLYQPFRPVARPVSPLIQL